jgi:carboxymethylenebutenolidase
MGELIHLNTAGMHCIGGYLAKPAGNPKGGIVVVQEIFGVTAHICDVAEDFAGQGYTALAPACFDFVETDVELDYDKRGTQRGKSLAAEVGMDRAVEAVASAAASIQSSGRIGVVGYCWGGTVALLAAQRLALPAVSYYGTRNIGYFDQPLQAPVMFHFGAKDRSIPPQTVQKHRETWPDAAVYVYENAGHAFNRDSDPSHYDPVGGPLARKRTLAFFDAHLA